MRADRHQALVDFLLEAVADDGTTPFPANVLAGMRTVVRCETVSYLEWSPQELLEFSLAGAHGFHRGGPDAATAPDAARTGRPRQGRRR